MTPCLRIVFLVSITVGAVGITLLIASNVMYYRRTRDPAYGSRFWLGRDVLTRREYLMNRWG